MRDVAYLQHEFRRRVMAHEKPLSLRVRILVGILLALPILGGFVQWEVTKAIEETRRAIGARAAACDQEDGVLLMTSNGRGFCVDTEKSHLHITPLKAKME